MAKISEVVTIYPGMSDTVNLRYEFSETEKNRKRMQGYKPIKSHREIFLKIAKSFLPIENKVHLFVGHYGTGKSHLLLMLANYFSQTLAMPELKAFFENFNRADENISKQIQNLRGDGRYLVVIPDYESQEDFSENLLSALEGAFEREGVEEEIDSVYRESLRILDQWEIDETSGTDPLHKYTAFQDTLGKEPGIYNSPLTLKKGLGDRQRSALNTFKDIYNRLIGTPFRYSANNIVDILEDVIKSEFFKERFKGIVFLYDEFDYTLSNRRISIEVVEQFAELCRNSNDIVFIGSLHKELSAFSNEYSVHDFRTVQQRFKTIDMRTEGLEEIVTAIVNVEKDNPIFKTDVSPYLQQVYSKIPDIKRLGLFDWLQPNEIRDKIIEAVYPLHPLTMACLLELSTTIGSSNRTLFTFLGGEGIDEDNEYSYKSFINRTDILDKKGLLSLYTTDYLVDYFYRELDINNSDLRETIKKTVNAYLSSLKELKSNLNQEGALFDISNPIYSKILKLMLVFEIVGVPNNEANLVFGLNLQLKEKNQLKNVLKLLTQQKVVFYNKISRIYEFRRGTDVDWDNVIEMEKERLIETCEFNVAEEFLDIYKVPGHDKYLDAKKYNSVKSTDKRLLRVFETIKNFGQKKQLADGTIVDYFNYYEKQLFEKIRYWKDSYDGIVIYIIAETDEEIREAKNITKKISSDYVLVFVPENPIPIKDVFLELKAALSVRNSDEYSNAPIADQARLDESYIGDINKGYAKLYIAQRNKYINGRVGTWYGKDGRIIETKPINEQEPAYNFLMNLYEKFNEINDEEINRSHKALSSTKKLILRDAINDLLEAGQSIEIDTSFGSDKGFIRYLKSVFFDKQLLKKIDKKGMILSCEVEKNASKYIDVFPAIFDMIQEFESKEKVNVTQFINAYCRAPYGLGEVSLELLIAFFVKYFGDELSFKRNPNDPGEISIQSFGQVEEIINKADPFAIFEKRKLDNTQKEFLVELFKQFSQEALPVGVTPRLKEVAMEMKSWFDNLTKLAQSEDFYSEEKVRRFLQLMKSIDPSDPYHLLFEKMQTIWGYEEDDRFDDNIKTTILKGIKDFDEIIGKKLEDVEDEIFQGLLETFDVKGKTYDNLGQAIQIWFNDLDGNQRDPSEDWQSTNSQPLVKYLKDTQNLRKVLYEDIPSSTNYGLGKVSDWNTNNVQIYISKIKDGLQTVEDHRILVDLPILNVENAEKQVNSNTEMIVRYDNKDDLILTVKVPQNATEVWISYQGEDPTKAYAQKEKIKFDKNITPTKSSQTLKLVSVDKEANFSQIYTLQLKEKFEIKENLYEWEITIPRNSKEAQATIRAIANKLLEKNTVSNTDLSNILKSLAEKYSNES